jgi:hypothetical protein
MTARLVSAPSAVAASPGRLGQRVDGGDERDDAAEGVRGQGPGQHGTPAPRGDRGDVPLGVRFGVEEAAGRPGADREDEGGQVGDGAQRTLPDLCRRPAQGAGEHDREQQPEREDGMQRAYRPQVSAQLEPDHRDHRRRAR